MSAPTTTTTAQFTIIKYVEDLVGGTITAYFTVNNVAGAPATQSVVLYSGAAYTALGDYTHAQLLAQFNAVVL